MNTEKSAIEKMVEWLENRLAKPENVVAGVLLELVKTKARRLAAEEKAKPVEAKTDGALMEVECGKCLGTGLVQIAASTSGIKVCDLCKGRKKVFTQARPASPTAEASLVYELWAVLRKDDIGGENELRELIINCLSRYRPAPTAVEELVSELREWWDDRLIKRQAGPAGEGLSMMSWCAKFGEILAKYDKGGK